MFYTFTIMDRAINLLRGQVIPTQGLDSLITAYYEGWVKFDGPFKVLYMDGEGAMNTEAGKKELSTLGTRLEVEAPGQHASKIG